MILLKVYPLCPDLDGPCIDNLLLSSYDLGRQHINQRATWFHVVWTGPSSKTRL